MKQSKEIIAFYREIDAWIKAGCRGSKSFSKECGLCVNLSSWAIDRGIYAWLYLKLCDELTWQFIKAGLDRDFPFGSRGDYWNRADNKTMYECPKRLAWIVERLRDAEEQEKENNHDY